jgi:hypothetical protein
MIPQWAKQAGFNAQQLRTMTEPNRHIGYLLDHLVFYAEHGSTFDVTFFDREPIIEVQLADRFARKLWGAFAYGKSVKHIKKLLAGVEFSDGTRVGANSIWTFVWIPNHLDIRGIDLNLGEQIVGIDGETTRQIIRETYRCRSRAEEDFFLARWIAS